MKRTALSLGFGLLAAGLHPVLAIDVPQNRQEFVEAVAAGAGATKMEQFVVDKGLAEIYAVLEARVSSCLDVEVRRSSYVGYMEVSSSDYNPGLRKVSAGRAEFTLQVVNRPRGLGHTPPVGGLYIMAADLESQGSGRTEVSLYRPTIGFKPITRTLTQWLSGEDAACPKMK